MRMRPYKHPSTGGNRLPFYRLLLNPHAIPSQNIVRRKTPYLLITEFTISPMKSLQIRVLSPVSAMLV